MAGRNQLFFGRLRSPEYKKLVLIQSELDRLKSGPIERVFRDQLAASKFPRWIRRIGWLMRSNFQLAKRANRSGTGSVSSSGWAGRSQQAAPVHADFQSVLRSDR